MLRRIWCYIVFFLKAIWCANFETFFFDVWNSLQKKVVSNGWIARESSIRNRSLTWQKYGWMCWRSVSTHGEKSFRHTVANVTGTRWPTASPHGNTSPHGVKTKRIWRKREDHVNTMYQHKVSAHGVYQTGDLRKNRGSSASKRLATHGETENKTYIDTRRDVMQKIGGLITTRCDNA